MPTSETGESWIAEGVHGTRTRRERVVKPRLQIYDIELEVRRTLEAGLIKFDDRELRNENETRKERWSRLMIVRSGWGRKGVAQVEPTDYENFSDATTS